MKVQLNAYLRRQLLGSAFRVTVILQVKHSFDLLAAVVRQRQKILKA